MLQRGIPSHPLFGDPYQPLFCPYEYSPPQVATVQVPPVPVL